MNSVSSKIVWYLLAVAVVVLDQFTKRLAVANLDYGQAIEVLPVLNWTLLHNPGAAWSFLADAGGWQHWFLGGIAVLVSVVVVVWIYRLPQHHRYLACALALVLGGAIGNFWDRVTLGYVVDFISVHWRDAYFPAFNIADSAITCGAILLVIDSLFISGRESDDSPKSQNSQSHSSEEDLSVTDSATTDSPDNPKAG